MALKYVSGKRSDSKLIVCDGFVYNRDTVKKGVTYVQCARKNCTARGRICAAGERLTVLSPHLHFPSKEEEELASYRHSLRQSAQDTSSMNGFRKIFDVESRRFPVGSLLRGFPQDQQVMRRSRKSCFPPVPKNLDELHDLLNFQPQWRNWALGHDTPREFFRETVLSSDGCRVAVFVSPYFSELLCADGAEIAVDATFDVRPVLPEAEQLLCIHVTEHLDGERYCYPAAYALMESKSEPSYVAAFDAVKFALNGRMKPAVGMADFEKAVHNALKKSFPQIETSGCWFHFCNAIFGLARQCNLIDLCLENQFANQSLQKILALPLLPPGQIEIGLNAIEDDLGRNGFKNHFKVVIDHVRDYWFKESIVGVDTLSVFEMIFRTNNDVERGHFLLFNKINQTRPNIWVLLDALKMHDYSNHQDRQRVLSNVRIRRARCAKNIRQDENIKDMQSKLSEGLLTVESFLARACHCVEGLQKRLKNHYDHQARRVN